MINTLKRFQAWRTGEDERTLDETGLTPELITESLNWAISRLELNHEYKRRLYELSVEQMRYKPQIKRGGVKNYLISERVFNDIRKTLEKASMNHAGKAKRKNLNASSFKI